MAHNCEIDHTGKIKETNITGMFSYIDVQSTRDFPP